MKSSCNFLNEKLLGLILFVLTICQLNAQGTVKGVVTDKSNGECY